MACDSWNEVPDLAAPILLLGNVGCAGCGKQPIRGHLEALYSIKVRRHQRAVLRDRWIWAEDVLVNRVKGFHTAGQHGVEREQLTQ